MADSKEEEKKINPPGLDEGDIQLLKTYVCKLFHFYSVLHLIQFPIRNEQTKYLVVRRQ